MLSFGVDLGLVKFILQVNERSNGDWIGFHPRISQLELRVLAPKTCSFKRFSNVRNTRCSNSFLLDSKSRLDLAKIYINSKRFLNFTCFMSHIFFIRLTRVPSTLIVFHPSRHTCTHEPRTHTRFHAHTLSRTHTLACTHTHPPHASTQA